MKTANFRMSLRTLAILFVGSALGAQGVTNSEDALTDELLRLLNTDVSVAGRKTQKISDAPAIVSVITADDIRRQGYTTISEILSFVPGINVTESFYGYTNLGIRGNLQANYNNKWLYLRDGHSMFEPVTGDSGFQSVSVAQIKRIEILRGPGSTMYGTNAFTGVINIITFDGSEEEKTDVTLRAGSFGTKGGDARWGMNQGKLSLSFVAGIDKSNGYPYVVTKDENGRSGTISYKNDLTNGSLSLAYGDLRMHLGAFDSTKSKFGLVPTLVSTGDRALKGVFFDTSYTWHVMERLDLGANFYYDKLDKNELISWYPPAWAQQQSGVGGPEYQMYTGSKMGFNLQASYQFTSDWRMMSGLFQETQKVGPYEWKRPDDTFSAFKTSAWLDDHQLTDKGGYVQVDGRLGKYVGLSGGVRYNSNSVYGGKATPSAGLVLNVTDSLTFKALYGNAFRNPSIFELYVNTVNVLQGNLELKPEQVRSFEFGMDYLKWSHSFRLNTFWYNTSELIARSLIVPAGTGGNTKNTPKYGNIDGQKLSGIEGEVKGSFFSAERHFFNVSWLRGEEKKDSSDVQFIPNILANAGVNLTIGKFIVSPYLQYVGSKEGTLLTNAPVHVGGYTLVNLNLEYRFGQHLWASLTGKNLGDKVYTYPEYIRRNVPTVPGGPERAIYFQIGYRK